MMPIPLCRLLPRLMSAACSLALTAALGATMMAGIVYPAPAQTLLAQSILPRQDEPRLDVIYVPTPQEVVDRMLDMAEIKPGDTMIDFGCGDGRMVVSAAKRGARGLGVDINPVRIAEANENARKASVADRVEFKIANLFEEDLSRADVMAMYLLPDINLRLRPKILDTMKPGTRIVSHAFDMGDWQPDQRDTVSNKTVFMWYVPAKIEGRWMVEGEPKMVLDLTQSYQFVSGTAEIDGKTVEIDKGRLKGAELTFNAGGKTYRGRVEGNVISGDGWKAARV
jgi:SAM-dependent methyltransferase